MQKLAISFSALILLSGCNNGAAQPAARGDRGRYAGIGVVTAGSMWAKIVSSKSNDDKSAATLKDDDHIIIVTDTRTGEVRQCGSFSGYCVSMNPWGAAARDVQATPVKVSQHGEGFDHGEEIAVNITDSTTSQDTNPR